MLKMVMTFFFFFGCLHLWSLFPTLTVFFLSSLKDKTKQTHRNRKQYKSGSMLRTAALLTVALRKASMPFFSHARLSGLAQGAKRGTITTTTGVFPACRFNLVTSSFRIPDEVSQLPTSFLNPDDAAGNVHVVHVVGTNAFVEELTAFLKDEMLLSLSGHFHTESYQVSNVSRQCPSITLSLERLRNTEDALQILHVRNGDTKASQVRLRRIIAQHLPDVPPNK